MFKRILAALFFIFFIFSMLFAPLFPAWAKEAAFPDLYDIEQHAGDSPEVLAALAQLAADDYMFDYQRQRTAPQAFAGLSAGHYNEPIARTLPTTEAYSNVRLLGGVSFPLLGTWSAQKINALKAELQALNSRYNSQLLRARNLTALRKAYAVMWAEQKKEPFLRAFLANEAAVDEIFKMRREQGYLLETDRLEFMSAFENCRRELALSTYRKTQALGVISLATGIKYTESPIAKPPELPAINTSLDKENKDNAVELNPQTQRLSQAVRIYEEILRLSSRTAREATVDVGAFYNDDNPGTPGTGIYASILIKEPFGSLTSRVNASKMAASADVLRAQHEEEAAKMRIEYSLRENISLRDYSLEAIEFAVKRLISSCEGVREAHLRHAQLDGDTLENLQQSRYAYLRTAIDLIDAQLYYTQTHIELISILWPVENEPAERVSLNKNFDALLGDVWLDFEKEKPSPANEYVKLPIENTKAIKDIKKSYGVYIWDADIFLGEGAKINLVKIKELGFDRILISFNPKQINFFGTVTGRKALLSLLDDAKNLDITTELLLGDPAWALPEGREGLFKLLRFFESFPFAQVHLDIEPDSLPDVQNRRPELLRELFQTLNIAKKVTSKPIAISMHPRYFEGELEDITASLLEEIDISEIALMIYSTNKDAVQKRFNDIAARFPKQRFTLSQSVESVLTEQESWFKTAREKFYRYITDTYPSVLVQAWEDYQYEAIGGK